MQVVSTPNNSARFYRIESVSRGIFEASLVCVRRPTAWRDNVFVSFHPSSLHRCDGYAEHIPLSTRRHARWDCHSLCPDTDAVDSFALGSAAPPPRLRWSASAFSCHGRLRGRWSQRAALHRTRQGCFSWFPGVLCPWDSGRHRPPKTGLAQTAVRSLPVPVNASEFLAFGQQNRPQIFENTILGPSLKPAMHRAVVAEHLWQLVPLATGPHTKNDSIEGLAQIRSRSTTHSTSRIPEIENGCHSVPCRIWNLPDRLQRNLYHFLFTTHSHQSLQKVSFYDPLAAKPFDGF